MCPSCTGSKFIDAVDGGSLSSLSYGTHRICYRTLDHPYMNHHCEILYCFWMRNVCEIMCFLIEIDYNYYFYSTYGAMRMVYRGSYCVFGICQKMSVNNNYHGDTVL